VEVFDVTLMSLTHLAQQVHVPSLRRDLHLSLGLSPLWLALGSHPPVGTASHRLSLPLDLPSLA